MESTNQIHPSEKKSNSKVLLFTIIGILVALNAVLLYVWQKGKSEAAVFKTESTKENLELKNQLEEADLLLEKYQADSIALAGKNVVLEQDIIDKKNEISSLMSKLRAFGTATPAELASLRSQILGLNAKIKELEEQNAELKKLNADLESDRTRLTSENEGIKSENVELGEKVTKYKSIAQRLTATNIKVETVKKRWVDGKEVVTRKAKDLESLKIGFGLAENYVAESGPRTIYVKITGPEGVTITAAKESGTFPFDGKDSKYTYKIEEDFDKDAKQVRTTTFRPTSNIKKGKYVVEMYTEGYKMGMTNFTLD